MKRLLLRGLAGLLDIAVLAAAGAFVACLLGRGGRMTAGPLTVSITSTSHALMVFVWVCVARSALPEVPFVGTFRLDALPARARDGWQRLSLLAAMAPHRAAVWMAVVLLISGAVKLAIAASQPGFWTGDDVEIHEMTFAQLFDWPWRAWELRSPFYPMGVIFPVQYLVKELGVTDPAALVFVGRAAVAAISLAVLWLTFRISGRLTGNTAIAVLSVLILATNKLHTIGGSTELPRTVSSAFVLAAFALLAGRPSVRQAAAAGALVAVASAMRFSEEVYLAPAILQMTIQRNAGALAVFLIMFVVIAAAILGITDYLYWNEPYFSLKHIIDFTITKRLSTRGYEPFYQYVVSLPAWSNIVVLCLALGASRRLPMLALWTWLPPVLLSFLPHKEPRYLIPFLPFYSMLAAAGLWRFAQWISRHDAERSALRGRLALVVLVACCAALTSEVAGFIVPRSNGGIAAVRHIAASTASNGPVAVVQSWRIGGRLYLQPSAEILNFSPDELDDPAVVAMKIRQRQAKWLILTQRELDRLGVAFAPHLGAFVEVPLAGADDYRLFRSIDEVEPHERTSP